jgi:hypothetical protein
VRRARLLLRGHDAADRGGAVVRCHRVPALRYCSTEWIP